MGYALDYGPHQSKVTLDAEAWKGERPAGMARSDACHDRDGLEARAPRRRRNASAHSYRGVCNTPLRAAYFTPLRAAYFVNICAW